MKTLKYNAILISLVLLAFRPVPALAQEKTPGRDSVDISGMVVDIYGRALPDVSLALLRGGGMHVITDSSGAFTLRIPEGPQRIEISSLEHHRRELQFRGQEELLIYMTPLDMSSSFMEADLGDRTLALRNSISPLTHTVSGDEKYLHDESSPSALLKGLSPGLLSTSFSGMPGAGHYLSARGMRSLFTNNQPLVIIDGMPLEVPGTMVSRISGNELDPLSSINPLDITSITLARDAGVASYHGLQASNGVIIINTLDPTATQTTVDFFFRTGISGTPKNLPQLDHGQFKVLANEILASSPLYEEEYELLYPGLYLHPGELGYTPYQHNTDWQDEVFSNGLITQANLLVKGGDEISRYGLSLGYLDEDGCIDQSGFTAYNIRFTSYLNVYKWLEMKVNASLNNNRSALYPSATEPESNPILSSLFKSPLLSPYNYDDDGNLLQSISDIREFGISNPASVIRSNMSAHVNNRFMSSISLKARITAHLDFNAIVGLNLNSLKEELFRPENGMSDYLEGLAYSYSEANTNKYNSIFSSQYFSYRNTLGELHQLSGSAGLRLRRNRLEHDWGRAVNLPGNDEFSDLQSGDETMSEMGGLSDAYNALAFFAGGEYLLKGRYALNANVSFDFSSYIGKENATLLHLGNAPMALLYSVGAGWRISEEAFLEGIHWLDNAFIRASYGVSGNDDIGNINALNYYLQVRYRESTGLIPGTVPNTGLKHEDSRQVNLGMDLSFKGDRFGLQLDLFNIRTSDLLYFEPQEAHIGYLSRPANGGALVNKGLELAGFARILGRADWTWDLSANVTLLDNRVTEMDEDIITPFEGGAFITRQGYPAASFYGYVFQGVFSSTSDANGLLNDRGMPYGGGDAKFQDISGPGGEPDGIINEHDKTILGSPVPESYGQLMTRISYRRLSLEFSLFYVLGNEVFNYVRSRNEGMTGMENQSIKTLQRWQQDGDDTEVPRALWNDPVGNTDFSSRWVEDASYLRLKDLTLSYRVPDRFLMFTDALVFVSAGNLLTLTPYLGYDPEFSHSFSPMEQGLDYGMMPGTRKIVIGFKLGL